MSNQQKNSQIENGLVPGRKYRFEVASAEEAVMRIKNQMGDKARVVSVKQIKGKGFGRFMASPKLEIIATIPLPEENATETIPQPGANGSKSQSPEKAVETGEKEALKKNPRPILQAYSTEKDDEYFKGGERENIASKTPLHVILRRSGFADTLLGKLYESDRWKSLKELPLPHALAEVGYWLKSEFRKVDKQPPGKRIGFIGLPGVGKTTVLCKKLAEYVFCDGKHPAVIKVDTSMPNSDDALRVFCDVLGVPFIPHVDSEVKNLQLPDSEIFVDYPGLDCNDEAPWREAGQMFRQIGVDTRVLVVNAAYDSEILKRQIDLGHLAGATHLVMTHIDEMPSHVRLWPFVLGSDLTPWYFSMGQDLTSEYSDDVFEYLLSKTMPKRLYE